MKNALFLVIYAAAYALQVWAFEIDEITSIYFAVALLLLLLTTLLGRLSRVKEAEKRAGVFSVLDDSFFSVFISASSYTATQNSA